MTVAAIFGIVLASLSLICNIFGIFGLIVQTATSAQQSVKLPPLVMAVSVVSIVLSTILGITWLAVSIGLLKMAPWAVAWGRKLALIHIGLLVLTLAVSLILVAPETKKMAEAQFEEQQRRQGSNGTPPPPGLAKGFAAGMAYGGPLIGFVIGMILPTTMLIALNRPSVKAAMGSDATTGGYAPPM